MTAARSILFAFIAVHALACQRKEPEQEAPTPSNDLIGTFKAGAKAASGSVSLVQKGDAYELHLDNVKTAAKPPVHVYLVGHPSASTSRAVHETEMKYDFGDLAASGTQVIPLPGKPAPELRTVVLWKSDFGVNVGWATLSSPTSTH